MPAEINAIRSHRVAGLLVAVALAITSCGGDDDQATITESDTGSAPTEPMDTPSPMSTSEGEMADEDESAEEDMADDNGGEEAELAAGVYRAFSEEALAEPGYETNVIFFHASWCPECRAFEQSIEAGPIPNGVQILKADYDTETALKDKYGVDIQTTFVKVDDDGEMISKWVGYEQDRSIDNLLLQLG